MVGLMGKKLRRGQEWILRYDLAAVRNVFKHCRCMDPSMEAWLNENAPGWRLRQAYSEIPWGRYQLIGRDYYDLHLPTEEHVMAFRMTWND